MKCLLAVLSVALALGCTLATAPANGVRVETLGAVFDREPGGSFAPVPFVVTNAGAGSVFLAPCGERVMAAVDRWAGARWVQYSGDACPAVFSMAPLELPPGSRLESVRGIGEPGRYRLRLGVVAAASAPTEWSAVSAPFEVR
jgi:hypothetical protein